LSHLRALTLRRHDEILPAPSMSTSLPPEDVMPVLVADLADDESRDVLEAAAAKRGRVCVPLEDAPVSMTLHVLEVHVPSSKEPFYFLAEPAGPPTADGFLLRIQPMPDAKAAAATPSDPKPAAAAAAPPDAKPAAAAAAPLDAKPAAAAARSDVMPAPPDPGADAKPTPPRPNVKLTPPRPDVKPTPPRPDVKEMVARADTVAAPETADVVRARRAGRDGAQLTASHTKDISHVGPLPTADDELIGRALANGKLKIESLLGRGGVGAVYKAVHRELKIPVAVKVLHESFQRDLEFCRRFYAEALAASRLDHPNITRVVDFGQEPDGLLYFAMEYLDGVELRAVLEREHALSADRIAEIMMQVCAGLSQAHARGIVHRDIKPENLVLVRGHDDDGQPIEIVKVCDFGIAQHRALAQEEEEGTTAGTPEYMSPEQCRGDELDQRSDVYACGVVLYELATGQPPFSAPTLHDLLKKQQQTPPMALSKIRPEVDPLLERIALKALAKDPAERHQTMRELRNELRELLTPILVDDASPPPSVVDSPSPPPSSVVGAPPPLPRREGAMRESSPDWLERGGAYANNAPASSSQLSMATPSSLGAEDAFADALQMDAAGWMARLAKTQDTRAFAQLARRLESAVRVVAGRRDAKTLWTVSSALHGISIEGPQAAGSRAHTAALVLRVFEDPAVLASIAEQLLAGTDDGREHARRLLVHAGVAGAYGLYGARVKLASDPAIRGPFGVALKDFGQKAWPVVRAALERIAAMPEPNAGALELAEDLLLCVPTVGDESAGHVVVKYLRLNVSGVCRAATASIVQLWGERAKPLLVGMLQSKEDVPRIAGIAGLRQLSGIDEHVVPRLHSILLRRLPAGPELRAAAAIALAHASPSARQPAISLLAQLLAPPRETPPESHRGGGALSKEDAVVVAIARSLLQIGGVGHRGLVSERADRSPEPLRSHLRSLIVGN
jgi:serine/threonine protein kinase